MENPIMQARRSRDRNCSIFKRRRISRCRSTNAQPSGENPAARKARLSILAAKTMIAVAPSLETIDSRKSRRMAFRTHPDSGLRRSSRHRPSCRRGRSPSSRSRHRDRSGTAQPRKKDSRPQVGAGQHRSRSASSPPWRCHRTLCPCRHACLPTASGAGSLPRERKGFAAGRSPAKVYPGERKPFYRRRAGLRPPQIDYHETLHQLARISYQ